jgi:RNase P/RNase MRP subunit p29
MFRLFGGVLVLAGPLTYLSQPHIIPYYFLIVILLLVGFSMIFLRYGLRINVEDRKYQIYTQCFGLRFGRFESFGYIEKYFINEVNCTTVMTTGAGIRHNIRKSAFKAYMKLDNGEKVHVDTDRNYEKLKSRIENYMKISSSALKSTSL